MPITSTVTEELTEHTQMRVNQRVYSMILMSPCRPSFTCLSSFTEIIPVAWRCVWSWPGPGARLPTSVLIARLFAAWSRAKWASPYWHVHTLAVASRPACTRQTWDLPPPFNDDDGCPPLVSRQGRIARVDRASVGRSLLARASIARAPDLIVRAPRAPVYPALSR